VLVGQPELQTRLDESRLRPLRQRVTIRYHLQPLPDNQINAFIQHRLRMAGRHTRLFTPGAVRRIASYTMGFPRLINIVCSSALLLAYAQDARMVSRRMVDEAGRDLLLRRRSAPRSCRRWAVVGTAAALLCLVTFTASTDLRPRSLLIPYLTDIRHSLMELLPALASMGGTFRRDDSHFRAEPMAGGAAAAVRATHLPLLGRPRITTQLPRQGSRYPTASASPPPVASRESVPRDGVEPVRPQRQALSEILTAIQDLNFAMDQR
jgi:hypothetical protein